MRKSSELREIEGRFPYMFEGPNIELIFYRGWLPIFKQLCVAVDAVLDENKRAFRWIQINEKLGVAKFYFHIDRPAAASSDVEATDHTDSFIYALVLRAERLASRTCMLCGQLAEPVEVEDCIWTLCAGHRPSGGSRRHQQQAQLEKAIRDCRLS